MLRFFLIQYGWFAALVLARFSPHRWIGGIAAAGIAAFSVVLLAAPGIDPLGWLIYTLFSYLVFYGAIRFKEWARLGTTNLNAQIRRLMQTKREKVERLAEQMRWTSFAEKEAAQIFHLYQKTKQMSGSLDEREAFWVLGEMIAENFDFTQMKLILLEDPGADESRGVREAYQLKLADLKVAASTRTASSPDLKKIKAEIFPFERRISDILVSRPEPLYIASASKNPYPQDLALPDQTPSLVAHPLSMGGSVFGTLIILGASPENFPMISILVERFAAELERVEIYKEVEKLAITDGLTGVYVRRHLLMRLQDEVDRCRQHHLQLSFLMIDIDNFKGFNDLYGHLIGDRVLREVAQTVRKNVREIDLVARYGGEEFCVVLPETDGAGALLIADRIRKAVFEKSLKVYDETIRITVSIGVSSFLGGVQEPSSLVEAADSALYQAKRQGKNKICLFALPNQEDGLL